MGKTALLIGATGLVGNELLQLLLKDNSFSSIKIFVRKKAEIKHAKLIQIVVDLNNLSNYSNEIKGDVIFCCIGTTMKVAGSKEAFIKIDFDIPLNFAKIAMANGVDAFILISSLGANKNSSNFYYSVKGKVEEELKKINFNHLVVLRPSMLLGNRNEFRFLEVIGKFFMQALGFIFIGKLKKYKAIEAKKVAKACLIMANENKNSFSVVESDEIQLLGA